MTGPSTPDPTHRFTDRVADYDAGRPTYPPGLLHVLAERVGFTSTWVVADVGSGTGISTAPFLDHGCEVYAVEPNAAMRAAAERRFAGRAGFHSVAGTAETTGLERASVDLVVAAQAFHWFDPERAREELGRVLRGPRRAVLAWNSRQVDATPFLRAYEDLLVNHGTDYQSVRHEWKNTGALDRFFPAGFERAVLPNEQSLDFQGLQSRLTSSSYVPAAGDARQAAMLADLRRLFEAHERQGRVLMTYDCEIFIGHVP